MRNWNVIARRGATKQSPWMLRLPRHVFQKTWQTTLAMTVIIILPAMIVTNAISQQSAFTDANAKYQSGDFKGALASYESLLNSGKETVALDYNLGNAHFRLGHKGRALVYYERALRIVPRDPDVLWNIGILKTAVADRIEPPDENLLVFWIRKITDRLTVNEISLALSGLLVLWAFSAFLTFIFPAMKPVGRGLGILTLMFALPAVVLFGFKWLDIKDPQVVILDKEVQARYGPSDKETKAFTVHEGAEAKVTDESKDWLFITLSSKNSGWIPKKTCETI